jgi:ABC-type transporter Mla subunit MlaD
MIVQELAETTIAASETIEQLSDRLDTLTVQVQQQGQQISALTDALQTVTDNQSILVSHIAHLTETLERIAASLESRENRPAPVVEQ